MEIDALTDPVDSKVKGLLKEVRLEYSLSFTKFVDDTVSAIKDAIDRIPDEFQVTADLAPAFVRDVGADKVEFKFKRPKSIEIGGSYATRCIAKPDVNIDLFIGLPKECFHEKDYLDHRYFAKRCLYLCIIKKYLDLSSAVKKTEWSSFQNEARKPILMIYPASNPTEIPGLLLRIIPTAKALFNISRLSLNRCNIRALSQEGATQATPIYNTSILEDMFMEENAQFISRTLAQEDFREALILLKVWARQRRSLYIHDCLNGFLISVILSYLASYGKVNNAMKAIQIFRITLDFIANSKLWKRGLFIKAENGVLKEERMQLMDLFAVIVCNKLTSFNLAFRITENGFLELQDEATLTLKCMEKCKDGGFEETFITRVDFPAKFDLCMRINLKGNKEICTSGFCLDNECWRLYEQKIHSVLCQGLTDRAKLIRVAWKNVPSEYDMDNGLSMLDREPLLVGICISFLDKAFRVVDIGPNAENKEEALKFRKFWGEKAELRRFKDGTIAESTIWDCQQWMRHHIIKRINEYVLLRHLSLRKEDIVHIVGQLDFCLVNGVEDPVSYSGKMIKAFEVLSNRLRQIQDIPLKVSSVQPLDSAFRFTSVFPPKPHPLIVEKHELPRKLKQIPSCIPPLDVMIQLEGSGNWPMDEVVIEKTKTAFLLKIAESLHENYGMTCSATEDDVDIFLSGFAFRLKLLHERGLSLLKRESGANQVKKVCSDDKKLFIRGQHSSMINGLQGRHQIYGPVVRLAKRWVASHLFSACLKEESVELLVAYLFLKPLPFGAPCSRITGFLRFLRLLSEYDWMFSPLIVDINNDFGPDDEKEINENFMASRKTYEENPQAVDPPMFIATAYDKASEAWTISSPNSLELKRLMAYARSSANLLVKLILHDQIDTYRWECLFRTPLSNYDAVILLRRNKLPYPQHLLFPSEMDEGSNVIQVCASKAFNPFMTSEDLKDNLEEIKNKIMVKFDPLQCFLDDLRREFPETFKAWYDSLGGDAIGLTWEKYGLKRMRDEVGEEKGDPVDVLKSIGEVGKGFVRSVHFLKAPRLMN